VARAAALRRHLNTAHAGAPTPRLIAGFLEREATLEEDLAEDAAPGERADHVGAATAARASAGYGSMQAATPRASNRTRSAIDKKSAARAAAGVPPRPEGVDRDELVRQP
jgi:hypothetical protein